MSYDNPLQGVKIQLFKGHADNSKRTDFIAETSTDANG